MVTTRATVQSTALVYTAHVFGWIYFSAWTFSFYPQIWMNYKTKSTEGLSYDFAALNLLGFFSYLFYSIVRYAVEEKYELPHAVEVQDLCFAGHAFILSGLQCAQIIAYDFEHIRYRFSRAAATSCCLILCGFIIHWSLSSAGSMPLTSLPDTARNDYMFPWWTVTDFMGFVKVCITIVKYLPQVLLNFRRKLTIGMAVWGFNLDFVGGSFSIAQNATEAFNYQNYEYIRGNYPKMIIGLIGLTYDIVLLWQHYVLYRKNNKAHKEMNDNIGSIVVQPPPRWHSSEEMELMQDVKRPPTHVCLTTGDASDY